MPDENTSFSKLYFGVVHSVTDSDGVEWTEVGKPVSFTFDGDDDDDDAYAEDAYVESLYKASLGESFTLKLTTPWYVLNKMFGMFAGRQLFTVRRLNRHRSWRGKWHRGGKGRV